MSATYRRSTGSLPHSMGQRGATNSTRRFVASNRAISPGPPTLINVDPELKDAQKAGNNYHISLNLNTLLAGGAAPAMNSTTELRKSTSAHQNNVIAHRPQPHPSSLSTTMQRTEQHLVNSEDVFLLPHQIKRSTVDVKGDDDARLILEQQLRQQNLQQEQQFQQQQLQQQQLLQQQQIQQQQMQQQIYMQQSQKTFQSPLLISTNSSPLRSPQQLFITGTLPSPSSSSYRVTSVTSSPFLRTEPTQRTSVSNKSKEVVCLLDVSEEDARREKMVSRSNYREVVENGYNDSTDSTRYTKYAIDNSLKSRSAPRRIQEEAPKIKSKKKKVPTATLR